MQQQQNQLVVVLETNMLILFKNMEERSRSFWIPVFIKQTKKSVYLGRILKDIFDLEKE